MSNVRFYYLPDPLVNEKGEIIGEIYKPFAQIRISLGHGNPSNVVDALVDSGSDGNLFPQQWGLAIGINFKKIKPKIITGIGNSKIDAYPAPINIWVNGQKYKTVADFSPQQQIPILGRDGFFNLFESVEFSEKNRYVEFVTK